MDKLKVAVIMGGASSEREVSILTGEEMLRNLDRNKYEVSKILWPEEKSKLGSEKIGVALLALHGRGGEDGEIQKTLEKEGIKYTGSGVETSKIGMNKILFKKIVEKQGILVPKNGDKIPCVVKPADGGSSVGVSIVKTKSQLEKAIKLAQKFSKKIIIEEYIEGKEFSCGVLGNEKAVALPVIEIISHNNFFDYEAKYEVGKAQEICPAKISDILTKKIQETTLKLYKSLNCRGYARVDVIVSRGKVYVLEINTLPGMTGNSLFPKEAKAVGIEYPQLLDKIISLVR